MSADEDTNNPRGRYASSPCMAAEIAPGYFDPLAVDPQQARDVARWRRAERKRLLAERAAMGVAERGDLGAGLVGQLRRVLQARFGRMAGRVLSAYWPIKGEPDLRPLMHELHEAGVLIALPVVEQKASPLVFRRWTPATRMVRGDWNIPVPPGDADILAPDVVIAPLVGWDDAGFRLGYGGGYFDRTLAALETPPVTIGTGPDSAHLPTIYPQPHDIAFGTIVTETGVRVTRGAS